MCNEIYCVTCEAFINCIDSNEPKYINCENCEVTDWKSFTKSFKQIMAVAWGQAPYDYMDDIQLDDSFYLEKKIPSTLFINGEHLCKYCWKVLGKYTMKNLGFAYSLPSKISEQYGFMCSEHLKIFN